MVRFKNIVNLMAQAVADQVFPGGVLLAVRGDEVVITEAVGNTSIFGNRRKVSPDTIFDLASLTKPLATTLAVMFLCSRGEIALDDPVLGNTDNSPSDAKNEITWLNLLCHTSGLSAYRPYYKRLLLLPESDRKPALYHALCNEPLVCPVGRETTYSDVGFLFLQMGIEVVVKKPFATFIRDCLYPSLGIQGLFFPLLQNAPGIDRSEYAATEICSFRGLLQGVVHDENAYAIGGAAGHAGLFGTVNAVYQTLRKILAAHEAVGFNNCLKPEIVSRFLCIPENAERTPGFDVPSVTKSSCGKYFSRHNTIGHLGYTGTSFWVELEKKVIVILLTNRVHPTRQNEKIREFRPVIHDEVMRCICQNT